MPKKGLANTVADVTTAGLCTSCGICAGACRHDSISFLYGLERNEPVVDSSTCVECGVCYEVCPGKAIMLNKLSEKAFASSNIKHDECAGYYLHAYVGHSIDGDIRFHSATGGMVTQFLTWLLEKHVIDGAVVVRYKENHPFEPEPFIATTKEEIWEGRSSKYVILSMDKVAQQIAMGDYKNIVVVGLPCQIQGWRQLASKNKKVRDAIKGYFAIYCSVNKTKNSIDYYNRHYCIDESRVGRFSFRDDGCMGFMRYEDKEGNVIKRIPYQKYWFGTHSFFTNPRCLMCIDQLGELADVSFGDIHIKPYSDDKIGTNSIISRSAYWDELLQQCKDEKAITLDVISVDTLVKSQIYARRYKKGSGVKAYMNIRKWTGKPIPAYDECINVQPLFLDYIEALVKKLMYAVGSRKSLWRIVELFDRK